MATVALLSVALLGSVTVTPGSTGTGPETWPWMKDRRPGEVVTTGATCVGATATMKLCVKLYEAAVPVLPLFVTVTVIVAVPVCPAAGVKVSVPVLLRLGWCS